MCDLYARDFGMISIIPIIILTLLFANEQLSARGVPDNHGDARGILEKRDNTPATV
jgi:hypothetical protein